MSATARAWWGVLLAVLAGAAAAAPWLRAFGPHLAWPALAGAAVSGVLVPVLSRGLVDRAGRWRVVVAVATDLVALAAYGLVVLAHGHPGRLADGLWHGPVTLLSYPLPLVDPPTLLALPVALTWLAGAVAGHTLGRGVRPTGACMGWAGAFVLAYATTRRARPDAGREDVLLAFALLVPVLLLLAVDAAGAAGGAAGGVGDAAGGAATARGRGPAASTRRLAAAVIASTAVLGITAAATTAPVADREARLAAREPLRAVSGELTPVALVSRLRTAAGADSLPVLDLNVDGTWSGYLPLADLDRYDGDGWTFRRDFQPSGGVVPAEPDPGLAVAGSLTQRYRVRRGLEGTPWLPHLGRARRVTGVGVDVEAVSGMPVPTGDLTTGLRYEVVSATRGARLADVADDAAPSLSRPPVETQLPLALASVVPRLVASFGERLGVGDDRPIAYLRALEQQLRADGGLTPPAAGSRAGGGTGFADVMAGVLGPTRTGTPEQYATLFAAIARGLGVPARVVCGFRLLPEAGSDSLAAGDATATAAQAWTWVEVPVQGLGWVVADPSPARIGAASTQPTVRARPRTSASPSRTPDAMVIPSEGGHAVASPAPPAPAREERPGPGIPWWPAVLALALAPVVAAAPAWWRRRRRRGASDPRVRLLGAWQEGLDSLAACGLGGLSPLTGSEVVDAVDAAFGRRAAEEAAVLAALSDVALFSPAREVTELDARRAWTAQRALVHAASGSLPPARRALAVVRRLGPTRLGPTRQGHTPRTASGGQDAAPSVREPVGSRG